MIFYLFIIGFISLLGQVVILRELNVAFYGIELIYILAIGFWLIGTAAGAYSRRKTYIPSQKKINILFIIFGFVLVIDSLFIRSLSLAFSGTPGTYLSFSQQIIGIILSVIPVSFILGLLFQWCAKIFADNGKSLALAYAIESAGGFIGAFASTYLMKFGFSNLLLVIICASVSILTTIFYQRKKLSKIKFVGFLLFMVILLIFIFNHNKIDHWITSWQYPNLLTVKDTPYSRVTITSSRDQISVFENGALVHESESIQAETFVHLPMLQKDSVHNVLILGGGVEGIINEIAKYPIQKVDYVELNKELIQLLTNNSFNKDIFNLNYEKLNIIYQDPREFLKKFDLIQKYDLILMGMPQPMSAGSNRFYTVEFFALCQKILSENGVLAFRLNTAENILTPQQQLTISAIYKALNLVFKEIVVLPGTTNIIMASLYNLDKTGKLTAERFESQNISAQLISSPYIKYLYKNDRFADINELLKKKDTRINSDSWPVCYQSAIMVWLSRFFPDFAFKEISPGINYPVYISIFIMMIIVFVLSRFRKYLRNSLLAAVAGFAGMVMETLFLLNYQIHCGILYLDIGLLLMAFMAGLTIGAYLMDKLAKLLNSCSVKIFWCGAGLLMIFVIQSILFFLFSDTEFMGNFLGSWIMIFISGFLTAGIFAYASFRRIENQQSIVSPLYAADLIGGAIGALIATLWLIPILGMDFTVIGIGGLVLAAVLLL